MKASVGRILMLVENPFPQDHRVRNEAVRLAEAGYQVSVIAKKYPNQKIFIVKLSEYIYLIPFVEDSEKVFLKTIYPSRKATKKFLKPSKT